ncbi:uncharacterized protein LOC114745180 [Neltuma alba]|uniref:uncharacterized protein LOC114745180 n=1 Tax=Neltuma alba TaxID=207710 RepID=UPI0010A523E6|nr:uncharacterized protein LOC114745180 [Prosopis alba]
MAEVPEDLQNLKKLQTLRFCDMPEAFTMSMQEGHSKYSIIKDIPHMFFRSSELGVNGYINNSRHLANIMKNRYGNENPGVSNMISNNLVSKGKLLFSNDINGIDDEWFWVTALLMAVLALLLAFASNYLEQHSFQLF